MLKSEASPEFKEKFDKPFNTLADRAKGVVETATIQTAEGERPATWDDFVGIYGLGEIAAHRTALQMFGAEAAPVVMRYYHDLHQLDLSRKQAADTERAEYQKRTTEEAANRAQGQEKMLATWNAVTKELSETVEDYHNSPEDKELDAARKKGYAIFDGESKTLQQKIVKDAHIRHRVAAFAPMKILLTRKDARIAELEAELAKHKPRTPGKTHSPGGSATGTTEKSFEDGLREHMAGA